MSNILLRPIPNLTKILALSGFVWGCATKGILDTNPKADVARLNGDYQIVENLGATPATISDGNLLPMVGDTSGNIMRLGIRRPGLSEEFALVFFPAKVDGTITLTLAEAGDANVISSIYNEYFEQMLRVHRLILRGDIREAKRLNALLVERYDTTWGSLVMEALLLMLDGKGREAHERFALARRLLPGDTSLAGIELEDLAAKEDAQ